MKKVKTFLKQLSYSLLPQSSHYEHFLQNHFSTSFAFFLKSQVFFSCIILLLIFININPFTINRYKEYINSSLNTVPNNLEISINKGELSSNLFRPFFFWINFPKEKYLFLVVDEKANPDKIIEYESSVLLTKNSIIAKYQNKLYTLPYFQLTDNLTLKKSDILTMSSHIFNKIKILFIAIFPLLMVIVPLSLFFTALINIILSSVTVYIFYRLFNKHYTFIKILQIGFYSSTLPILITIVLFSLFLWRNIPLFFPFTIFLIFQITGVFEAHYNKSNHAIKHHIKK